MTCQVFGVVAVPRQHAEDVLYARSCLRRFESFATQFGGLAEDGSGPSEPSHPAAVKDTRLDLEWEVGDATRTAGCQAH